ncbi:hypothetical protein UA38_22160 [Photobacterium kishitanii]|uniref:Uncharacterized protein n=1 Tax=Photobacterium kishitanii TaxID=318456 RepID=A0AAX0Z138_9GAMM|nr:hypothetical protein UA38_22160 [Photobacterium kishitanii]KJG62886.1 hypothetical protein UA42_00290 [Photobacterium kishitanii]KJG63407.1 hypothetical protein UA40_22085 [Photobacterium kishitanii]PSX20063.1 hypothetical protein C0W70_08950 [Photobacterium kishitanii]PSX27656.1 hypothetical protein C0W39_22015 [Photobacterium kishitanii]
MLVVDVIINKLFPIYKKNKRATILKTKIDNIRDQLIQAVCDDDKYLRDDLLFIYESLLIDFECVYDDLNNSHR